ncbi:MAG: dTDP-4-dehydrorhamnose 3,5-epimerase [Alphaproteobacteria bacterium]|tara:strand:- start:12274 stop:12822 length:549 start_codon:yes stop_codon:yes gene_type:complete
MIIKKLGSGALSIKPKINKDDRGSFFELYNKESFLKSGLDLNFNQDNMSFSKLKNTIRGLHCQKYPYEQSKFVYLIAGSIIDFFIDIRKDSKNFGKSYSLKLSNYGDGVFIPSGFLHGYCTLEDNTIIGYKVDEFYNSKNEIGLIWNDPVVDVQWPFDNPPIVSEKDSNLFTWDYFKKEMGL